MWRTAPLSAIGAIALAWIRSIVARDAELASPVGIPIAHGSGPDPDRLLVMGSPIVEGVGVASYDLSFGGHLARKLSARTGRGADVELRGIDRFDALTAAEALAHENLARFDLVLMLGGVTEIVSLMPLSTYRRNLDVLFDAIRQNSPRSTRVLIAGVAPFLQDMSAPPFVTRWMQKRIDRQNEVTRLACEASGVAEYVAFAPVRTGVRPGRDASLVYESWAVDLLPVIDRALATDGARAEVALDEVARQRALDELGVDPAPDATVDRIVAMARDMLGVEAAAVNLVDHDRLWSKSTVGIAPREVPRDQSMCDLTIKTSGVHVIEDVDEDPDFRDARWASREHHVRFYAGYPLEAPGGERVGALCVIDREPRHFSSADRATLRDLALAAQAALWERTPAG